MSKVVRDDEMTTTQYVITSKDCNDVTLYLRILSRQEVQERKEKGVHQLWEWQTKKRHATKFEWMSTAFLYAIENAIEPDDYEVVPIK